MTDYEKTLAEWNERTRRQSEANDANRAAIFDALAALGIERIEVRFDGCGDSGQIEDISITGSQQELTGAIAFMSTPWSGPSETKTSALAEAVEHLCYDLLAQTHDGWEDNEGAFGEFIFHVAERAVTLEFNERYVEHATSIHTFGEA